MRAKSEYPTRHADQHEPEGSDALTRAIWYEYHNVGDWLDVFAVGTNPDLSAGSGQGMRFYSPDGDIVIETGTGSGAAHWVTIAHGTDDLIRLAEDSVFLQSLSIANRVLAGGEFVVDRPTTLTHDVGNILLIDSDTGDTYFRFVDAAGEFVIEKHTPSASHGTPIFTVTDAGALTFDGTSVDIQADSGTIVIQSAAQVTIESSADPVNIDGDLGVNIESANGLIQANLGAGQSLIVNDSGFNPIFQVDEDGTVHIKTGTTIVADL